MQPAEPGELRILQPGNHPQHPRLVAVFQLGLEAHHVEERAERIVLPELHDGMGFHQRIVGVGQADRLHRAVAQRLAAALRHHLDGQAAVEIGRRGFPFLEVGLVAGNQRIDEGFVLRLVHRAVDVILAVAARPDLVVARLEPGHVHVDGFAVDDGRDGVEEGQLLLARQRQDRFGQGRRGEGAGGDDHRGPFLRRQAGHFAALDGDERMGFESGGHGAREAVAIDRERAAGRNLMGVALGHDQRAQRAHFLVQQADRIGARIVRAEGVGADELGEALGLVSVRAPNGAHLVQDHRNACLGDLPGGFGPGKAAADDVDGFKCVHCLPRKRALLTLRAGAGQVRAFPTLGEGSDMSAKRPVVLITGGSRGIGAALAQLAASRGYDVAINYRSERDAAERVAATCRAPAGPPLSSAAGDVAIEADVIRVFDEAEAALGPALARGQQCGHHRPIRQARQGRCATLRACIDVNVLGALWVAREAARRLSRSHGGLGGSIVNISSVAARLGSAGEYVWYAATKGAVDSLTIGFSQELAGDGRAGECRFAWHHADGHSRAEHGRRRAHGTVEAKDPVATGSPNRKRSRRRSCS